MSESLEWSRPKRRRGSPPHTPPPYAHENHRREREKEGEGRPRTRRQKRGSRVCESWLRELIARAGHNFCEIRDQYTWTSNESPKKLSKKGLQALRGCEGTTRGIQMERCRLSRDHQPNQLNQSLPLCWRRSSLSFLPQLPLLWYFSQPGISRFLFFLHYF